MKLIPTLAICVTLSFTIGCKKSSSDSPDSPQVPTQSFLDVEGNWSGIYSTNLVGSTAAVFTLAQTNATITGTLVVNSGTGAVTGIAGTNSMAWDLTMTIPGCPGTFSGVMTRTGDTVNTSFNGSDCLGTHTGSGAFQLQ